MLKQISRECSFGGWHERYQHYSHILHCDMTFAIYLPPQAALNTPLPVLYFLSGLTCTDANFMEKSGAQLIAAELGIILVSPDTSPRGTSPNGEVVPDDPNGHWDFGLGAGFYLNATEQPWSTHYHMHDYVVHELPECIEKNFNASNLRSISGHSMGGHGALVCALRQPQRYQSVSAFAPIAHPIDCPWGQKAFSNYLGENRALWQEWDACALIANSQPPLPILIDQGDQDEFLEQELKPNALIEAAKQAHYPLTLRFQAGYDHSYFFIATFIEDHLRYHAHHLLHSQ